MLTKQVMSVRMWLVSRITNVMVVTGSVVISGSRSAKVGGEFSATSPLDRGKLSQPSKIWCEKPTSPQVRGKLSVFGK